MHKTTGNPRLSPFPLAVHEGMRWPHSQLDLERILHQRLMVLWCKTEPVKLRMTFLQPQMWQLFLLMCLGGLLQTGKIMSITNQCYKLNYSD